MPEQDRDSDTGHLIDERTLDERLQGLDELAERIEEKIDRISRASAVTQETLQLEFQI